MPSGTPDRESTRHSAGLLLRVGGSDGHCDEFYLAGGLTIGRTLANTIVVDDESVDRTHARIEIAPDGGARLRCVEPDGRLTTGGEAVRELPLGEGVRFRIGGTEFECVSGRRGFGAGPDRTLASCPFCGSTEVATAGQAVRPCPECHNPLLPVPSDPGDSTPVLVPVAYGDARAERYVARGGMGLVLRGVRPGGEPVAIKILRPGADLDRRDTERFEQEVAMLARVRHPNVVKLLDHGMSGRYNFLALEWIEGPSLRRVIADADLAGRLTDFPTAFRWFEQVGKGMAAIHAVGIIHRDIKPSNILIGPDGAARIADLGIAKRVDAGHTSYTTTGHAPGTFAYMAPEQLASPDTVDGRIDLYALGVTFYELLTGTRPVGAWRPASEVNPTVPEAFDAILNRLLAPSPGRRYGDIYELLSAIFAMDAGFAARREGATGNVGLPAAPGPSTPGRSEGGSRAARDRFAAAIGAIQDRNSGANVAARNGAIWGAVLLGFAEVLIQISAGLFAAIDGRDLAPSRLIWDGIISFLVLGFIGGGLVGAIWFAAAGATGRGPGTVRPVSVPAVLALVYGFVIRLWEVRPGGAPRSTPTYSGGRTDDDDGVKPPDHRAVAGGNLASNGLGLGDNPQIRLALTPARGERSIWILSSADGESTLFDPQGERVAEISSASAEGAFTFPNFWSFPRAIGIRGDDGVGRLFRCERRTSRAIRDVMDSALEKQGPEVFRSLRRGGYRHLIFGSIELIGGVGLSAWSYANRVKHGEHFIFWGLFIYGVIRICRGFGTFLRIDGIQQKARAGLKASNAPDANVTLTASVEERRTDSAVGPWPPELIVFGMLVFGPLWAGLMTALNWRRLNPAAGYRRPIVLGLIAAVGFLALLPSGSLVCVLVAISLAIGLCDLHRQQKRFESYRLAGGRPGMVWLPLLLVPIGYAPACWPVLYNYQIGMPRLENRVLSHLRAGKADLAILECNEAIRSDPSSAFAYSYRGLAYAQKQLQDKALADADHGVDLGPGQPFAFRNRGVVLIEQGGYDLAIVDCTSAIELDPNFADAYSVRGLAHIGRLNFKQAEVDLNEAIRIDPSLATAYSNRALAHLAGKNIVGTIADSDRAIQLDPGLAEAFLWRGSAHMQNQHNDQAIADLTRAISLDPSLAIAYSNRGLAFLARDEWDRAVADFDEAIRLSPDLSVAASNRGLAHLGRGEPDRTLADCDRAIELDPSNAEAFLWRGQAYNLKGDPDRAISDLDEAIRLDPSLAQARNNRGSAYRAKGDMDRAIADFDVAIQLDPKLSVAYNNRGLMHLENGVHDKARADFDVAIKLAPNLSLAYSNRAMAHLGMGNLDQARADCDRAIELDPGNSEAFFWRGSVSHTKGDPTSAILDLTEAIRLAPKLVIAHNERGLVYYTKGEHERAVADYDEAIRLNPEDPVILGNRALAHQAKGNLDAAVADLKSALRLNPPDAQKYRDLLDEAESAKRGTGR